MTSERIFVALDLETTGLDANRDTIIEIGAVKFQGDAVLDRFETLINPRRPIPVKIQQITGIDDSDVADAPLFGEVVPELIAFVGNETSGIVAHNASFDLGFMRTHGVDFRRPAFDTLELAALLLPRQASYSLGELSHSLQIVLKEAHRALDDAEATAHLFMALMARLDVLPPEMLAAIVASGGETDWSPLRLFADKLERAGINPNVARKSLSTMVSPQARARAAAIAASAPPEEEGDYRTVPVERLASAFATDGALGRLMGETYEQRDGQVEMARRVLDAFNRGDHLMVEAGTGTGKSLAYLLPAALWAVANRRRVVVATNTLALQDQLLDKEIPQVTAILQAQDDAPVRGALLKGRRNYLCLRRLHEWRSSHMLSPQELSVLARVLVWLPTTIRGDVAELALPTPADREIWSQLCSDGATCSEERCGAHVEPGLRDFYTLARREAEAAHIVVVNHALLFADLAAEGNVLPNASHLIIDEAHHLEEAATDQMTWRIEFGAIQMQLRQVMEAGDLARSLLATAGRIDFSEAGRLIRALDVQARETSDALRLFHHVLLNFATHYILRKGEQSRGKNEQGRGKVESSRGESGRAETSRGERGEGNFAQRQTIDGSARSQPLWSEVEIEWENAAESLRRCSEGCEALLMAAEREAWTELDANRSAIGQLRALFGELTDLHERLEVIVYGSKTGGHGGRVCWIELNEYRSAVTLLAAPLQVSDLVQTELIHRLRSVILTGATLRTGATFRYVRERLGLWDVPTAIVDSPFDYLNSVLLFMPSDLAQPNSPAWQPGVEQAIVSAAQACKGRTLVLFTSYAHLRTTADAVRAPLEKLGIHVLQQGATSRHKLLRDFRAANEAVLMGTRTYWEGIDLPGDEVRCLLIAKLPFAVPNDPLVAARSAESEDSFTDYMLPDAVLRFRQGFGRLIRRASDRGVVVLLDSRVWRKEYGQIFLDALPPCTTRNAPLSILGSEVKQWLSK